MTLCIQTRILCIQVLELYAAGRENGVVLGVGAQCASAVLVHEGLPDPRTLLRSGVAGEALTAWTARLLGGKGGALDEEVACRAKEQLGAVTGAEGVPPPAAAQFELPDGRKLTVTPEMRGEIAEPLFRPQLVRRSRAAAPCRDPYRDPCRDPCCDPFCDCAAATCTATLCQVGEAGGGLAQLVLDCIKLRDRDGVLESEQRVESAGLAVPQRCHSAVLASDLRYALKRNA